MSAESLGNVLYRMVVGARHTLFTQGEIAQLTYVAFDHAAAAVQASSNEDFTFDFPIGYRPDRTSLMSKRTYDKQELLNRYNFLAQKQLGLNGIVQLVTVVEALCGDLLRAVIRKHPRKLGAKRTMPIATILESGSIEEIHLRAADALVNELAYKSPTEYAEALKSLLSVNLLECPAFHRYVEIKATRDIYIHNRGLANEVYVKKAASHARATTGQTLPVDSVYFLEAYEACLQLTEWLEHHLHDIWPSSEFEERQRDFQTKPPTPPTLPPSSTPVES